MTTVNKGREITLAIADMISNELGDWRSEPAAFELAAFAIFGTAASATDWWLGAEEDSPRRMPAEKFVAHMTTIMVGAINGTCRAAGHPDRRRSAAPHGGPSPATSRLI